MRGKGFHVVDLEGEVGEVRPDLNGATAVELADFDQLLALRRLQEHEFGTAAAFAAPHFLQSQHFGVEGNRPLKICHAVAGVEEFRYHHENIPALAERVEGEIVREQNVGARQLSLLLVPAMIVLLGGSGYVGCALADALRERSLPFVAPGHRDLDLTRRDEVAAWFAGRDVRFVINAVGYTGRPNIDSTEREKLRCLEANTIVPAVLAEVLADLRVRWGHVSSGCIFNGTRPDGSGFTEEDEPDFVRFDPRAGWYARTKWMAESMLRDHSNVTIWRLRIPFDGVHHPRNYLSKLCEYDRLLEVKNSISHLGDFASAAVETLLREVPPGLYNVTNPGAVWTSEVVEALARHGLGRRDVQYFGNEADFLAQPGRVYRANCLLSEKKLLATGIRMPEVREAIERSLREWKSSK